MNAELKIAPELRHDPRPRSAVSGMTGAVGLVALLVYAGIARTWHFSGPNAALCAVVGCALPMVLWSVLVEKVHRGEHELRGLPERRRLYAVLST